MSIRLACESNLPGVKLNLRIEPHQRLVREKPMPLAVPAGINDTWSISNTPASRVVRSLNQVIEWRGKPFKIRRDNGPELISSMLVQWAAKHQIEIAYIQPGNPQQNAYIERYKRTVRYDWLSQYLFESIDEVQDFATDWMWTYDQRKSLWGNHERPNMGLGGITPKQKLALAVPASTFSLS